MNRLRCAGAAVLSAASVAVVPAAAGADSVSAERFRILVETAAAGDEPALTALRRVDAVDGRPVDMGVALAGSDAVETARRMSLLAGALGDAVADDGPGQARAEAQQILAGSDYRPAEPPRPLRAPLRWLGERLAPLGRPFAAAWDWVADGPQRFVPLGILVALVSAVATVRLGSGRSPLVAEGSSSRRRGGGEDPDVLERAAAAAEEAGDYAAAVRLRFRAGLLRLDRGGVLAYRPSLTTGAVTAVVSSPTLAALAADFERIAYGHRPATAEDAAGARDGWRAVLVEHGR